MPNGSKTRYTLTALAYDKRGRLLSVGRNSYTRTHPMQAKYGRMCGKPAKIFIHAELDALLKARSKVHSLLIYRFDKQGKRVTAAPCDSCKIAIKDFGVKHVCFE